MASIRLDELQRLLAERGQGDALPWSAEGFYLEISFERPGRAPTGVVDRDWANRGLSVETAYGSALLVFDDEGLLKSIEIS